MRISTAQINRQATEQLLRLGQQAAKTQRQISSGRRILTPGDDPVAAARIVKISQEIELRNQFTKNIQQADAQLVQEDSVLSQAIDLLQRVRELSLQAGSGIHSQTDREFIAIEISARFDELLSLLNSKSAGGEYLFSGYQGDVKPFSVEGERIEYNGDEGQRRIQIDNNNSIAVSDSGFALFVDVTSAQTTFATTTHPGNDSFSTATITQGAVVDQEVLDNFYPDDLIIEFRPLSESVDGSPNYTVRRRSDNRVVDGLQNVTFTPSATIETQGLSVRVFGAAQPGDVFFVESTKRQGVLETVQKIQKGLETLDVNKDAEQFTQLVGATVANLDNAITSILEVRSKIGARLNSADTTVSLHEELNVQSKTVLSQIRDIDFAEAVSRLSLESFILEAAQQSFIRVSNLSLFNLL